MKPSGGWSYPWLLHFTIGCLFGATVLRSLIKFQGDPDLGSVLGLLTLWLLLWITEAPFSRRWGGYFALYLILQSVIVSSLLFAPQAEDYFATLFGVLSMQLMQRFNPRAGALWIGLFAVVMAVPLIAAHGPLQGGAFVLIYTFGGLLLAGYALAIRRAQDAHRRNYALAQQLQDTNRQLQAYARQSRELVAARERHHLARELHDSVTQTIFSMTLTTYSAVLLLDREPGRVAAQLNQLNQLALNALAEMQILIAELRPNHMAVGGLAAAIRRHLAERSLPEQLSASVEVEGDRQLDSAEEQGLFRIVQEALNNVVKHAQSPCVSVRLHLTDPVWIEVADKGKGFDLQRAGGGQRVGLTNMSERAAEIGWELRITTAPESGTCIRVEKKPSEGTLS